MTRIVHLSDLHFGAHDPALIAPLVAAVRAARPDLVAISGDLAQRGTRGQMAQARQVLARLPQPILAVPGNHDLPHFNPLLRFTDGFRRFRRATDGPEEPLWSDGATTVAGLNTTHRMHWTRGEIGPHQIERLHAAFARADAPMRVLVMHHPLEHAALNVDPLMVGASEVLEALPAMGVRIVLSGHVHVSYVAPFRDAPWTLFVQSGTALSTRRRGQENCFLCLDTAPERVRIARHFVGPGHVAPDPPEDWHATADGWTRDARPAADRPAGARRQLPR